MRLFFIFAILFTISCQFFANNAKETAPVSDISRKIHGSYGPFRDFTAQDCDKPHENKWMRCAAEESEAFIYHWNNQLKGCERKIYKGCGATRNNFLTERDCNKVAEPVCAK